MSDIRFADLLQQMRERVGSLRRLATAIGVTEKTIQSWLRLGPELRLHAEHRDRVLQAASMLGVEPELHASGVCLWDLRTSYAANVGIPPPIPPVLPPDGAYTTPFLDTDLNSPFGASASVVTCTAGRIRFLAHTRNDLLTYKTVRSREYRGYNTPNIFCVNRSVEALDPDRPVSAVTVVTPDDCVDAYGYVNRYGMPCPPPERWQADFAAAHDALLPGQMLVLSIVGTADHEETQSVLIADFMRVAQMAVDAGAGVIEINASCPNCFGMEGAPFHDVPLLTRVCQAVRQVVGARKLILKIGYLKERELSALVHATLDSINAFAAINTIPVEARRDGQVGQEPAFGIRAKAGLSGPAISRYGRCIKQLQQIRCRGNLSFGIIGVGGVTTPADVMDYMQAGADVVQACSIFFKDPFFGIKVRRHLVAASRSQTRVAENEAWAALANSFSAVRQLQHEYPASKLIVAANTVLIEWQADQQALIAAGPRKSLPVPSIDEFRRLIKKRVDGH